MNKIKTILFSIMTILAVLTVVVNASEPILEITGDTEAEAGETKTLVVKILSETDLGVYSGKIIGDENISNIQLTGKNGWSVIAKQNESFKLIKAEGGKNEEVLEITYTIAETAQEKVSITLSSIELTTIDYETKKVGDINKEIMLKTETPEEPEEPTPAVVTLSSLEITKAPTKTKYTEGEKFDKAGLEVTAKYSDNTSKVITDYTYEPNGALKVIDEKITISYTENEVTKTVEQAITVEKKVVPSNTTNTTNTNTTNTTNKTNTTNTTPNNNSQNTVTIIPSGTTTNTQNDNTVANKELSKAGVADMIFFITVAIAVFGIVFYINFAKMKDVK